MANFPFFTFFDWKKCVFNTFLYNRNQRCAKLYILSRNHNQYATGGRFRTTKSKPICITAFFRNQNRNQYLYFEQIRNQNQNQYALAALFKIKTATNMIILEILIK